MSSLFSIPIFFITLREAIEASIIVSVLLAVVGKLEINEDQKRHLSRKVWLGAASGLAASLSVGAVFLFVWYKYAINWWTNAEKLWEGIFGTIAGVMVGLTGFAMLKGSKMYSKYQRKLGEKLRGLKTNPDYSHEEEGKEEDLLHPKTGTTETFETRGLFWLPFVTNLREGLEGVVFIGGVSLSEPVTAVPLAAICGIAGGILLGFFIHFSGSRIALHWFFSVTSCVLFLLAAGLLTRSVGSFEDYVWSQATHLQVDDIGTGVFDPRRIVWHLDCCSPENKSQAWGIFNSLLGWRNNATISTILSYCLFWLFATGMLIFSKMRQQKLQQQKQAQEFKNI